ncbi:MAG: 30S ribosomal protein S15 [Candidatus Pacearchaeota archaeon]
MATLYGHGRGKAGSHAPKQEKPYWVSMKPEEVEELVVSLAKQGFSTSKIGFILRDTYGIPSVKSITGKKIKKILSERGIKVEKEDLNALLEKEKRLKKHLEKNKHDMTAKRGLQLTQAKIRRLEKYYAKRAKQETN